MKKNKFLKILCIAIALCITGKVKAKYNGYGGTSLNLTAAGSCTAGSAMCENMNHFYLQVRMYYIDNTGGKFEWSDSNGTKDKPIDHKDSKCDGTYYFSTSSSKTFLINSGVDKSCIYVMDNEDGGTGTKWKNLTKDKDRYSKASAILRGYFGDDDNQCENQVCTPNKNLKKYLNGVTTGSWDTTENYASKLTKDSQVADKKKAAIKGYRMIIEPALIWNNTGTSYGSGLYTSKQAAGRGFRIGTGREYGGSGGQGQYLFTEFDDVGIKSGSKSRCSESGAKSYLADWADGCGMNIIDVGKYISVHYCYEKSVEGGLTCEKYDRNNESDSFKETYTKKECTAEEDLKDTNSEYGKKIADNENCTLYCSESAFASFPGGITKDYELGMSLTPNSYFAWPARYGSKAGMKMYMTSKYNCRVVQKEGKTCSSSDISAMVTAAESSVNKLKIGAKLTAGNYRKINAEDLVVGNTTATKDNTSDLSINEGKTEEFSVAKTTYLEIKTTTNRYYNKKTRVVSDNGSSWPGAELFDRGQGVVSLSEKETEVGKKYPLTITDVQLGTGNQYGKLIGTYTCKFEVGPSCVCPAGTLKAGTPLYMDLTEGKTCVELQRTRCGCECPDDSPEAGQKLDDKLSDNPTTAECESLKKKYCYHSTCEDVDEKTFKSCLDEQTTKYKRTLAEATEICNDKYCPRQRCERVPKETWDKCISDGYSYAVCYRKYCPYPGCKDCTYKCTTTTGEEKDISQCISDRQSRNGETFRDAKVNCTAEYCPSDDDTCENGKCPPEGNNCTGTCVWSKVKKGNTLTYVKTCNGKVCSRYPVYCPNDQCIKSNNVVYRTIDLDNPFPGNKNGVTTQFSNDGIKGRLPSTNWYDVETVKEDILNARGVKGNKLYTEKTPLYRIVLTPQTIKEVREYNKKNEKDYSDFNLNCKTTDKSAACISDFLHTTLYSAIDRNNSVANCYNMQKSEAGFNACYNKDN